MILLIWDTFGEDSPKFYEFADSSRGAQLAAACHEHYVNCSGHTVQEDKDLDELNGLLLYIEPRQGGQGNFGPYSAIYISGFIP